MSAAFPATNQPANHYPGPWRIDGLFDAEIAVEIRSADGTDYDNSLTICEIEPCLEEWSPEEIANVRLIAAAPRLYKACKVVKNFLDGLEAGVHPLDESLAEMRRRVHAPLLAALNPAIDQAEGRAESTPDPICPVCSLPLAHTAGPGLGERGFVCLTPGCSDAEYDDATEGPHMSGSPVQASRLKDSDSTVRDSG